MGPFDIILIVAFGLIVSSSAGLAIKEAVKRHKENKARKNPPTHSAGETFNYDEYLKERKVQSAERQAVEQPKHTKEEPRAEQTTTGIVRRR